MRVVIRPTDDPVEVYMECVGSVSNVEVRGRLSALVSDIQLAADDYLYKAENRELYSLTPNDCGNDELVVGNVTKNELKGVYSTHMVGMKKPARQIYESLMANAPLGKCPFCGVGVASTLDHYLPKTKFPQFSVLPHNLVPSCKDCNTGKSTKVPSFIGKQSLHPYFDHGVFITDQWLFAEVFRTTPATISFYVDSPAGWDDVSKDRVRAHFECFKLNKLYSVEACNQLASLRNMLIDLSESTNSETVRYHLQLEAKAYKNVHVNSWQTALYQALSENDWYYEGGYI